MTAVLVVEDSLAQSTQIRLMLKKANFEVFIAENGREALDLIENHELDVVLTDLQMPELDGLQLVAEIAEKHSQLPVVLMTQHGSEEIALDALRQGAASYLPKNQLAEHMIPILDEILESARLAHRQEQIQKRRFRTEIQYRLETDPALIGPLSAQVEQELEDQHFADPAVRRQIGVALRKALDNAIYHGNLELCESDRLQGELAYRDLAERRRCQPPWCRRNVWVTMVIDEAAARLEVRDEGPGFDVDAMSPPNLSAHLDELRGSGLLLINTFMDHVEHNAMGNQITMTRRRPLADSRHAVPRKKRRRQEVLSLDFNEDALVITVLTEHAGFSEAELAKDLDSINRILERGEVQHVIADFSRIEYFTSTLLEALRKTWLRVKKQGGQMVLCGLSPGCRKILALSRFDTIWPVYADQAKALSALHKAAAE